MSHKTSILKVSVTLITAASMLVGALGMTYLVRPTTAFAHTVTAEPDFWVTDGNANGVVNDILTTNDVTYIGGVFTTVGPYRGHGVPLSVSSGQPTGTFPQVNDVVRSVVADGSGGWFIGGEFLQVGTSNRSYLAHILSNGTVDPAWNPSADNIVYDIFLSGSTLYVAGDFTVVGGQNRNRIAAIDATTGTVSAWDPDSDFTVSEILVSGTTAYVGGQFTTIGGASRNNIAALDTTVNTNQATSWDPNADGPVQELLLDGTTMYVGGSFGNIGGAVRTNIAALDTTVATNQATAWAPDADTGVLALAKSGNTVYAGGSFTGIGGATRNYVAALDATVDTNQATAWNPNASAEVEEILLDGTTLYVGGDFISVGGQDRLHAAALDTTVNTNNATTWDPAAGNSVEAMALNGSVLYVGGMMQSVGAVTRNGVAALDNVTGAATSWNPDIPGTVGFLALSGTTLYIGGSFSSVGGLTRNNIAAVSTVTGVPTAWDPDADALVTGIVVSGSTVYVSGDFANIGGAARNRIAALDATVNTNQATAWNPDADNTVDHMVLDGTTLYAGGMFGNIGGAARTRIAALDTTINTNNATSWNPGATGSVLAIAIDGNTVYLGGTFISAGGSARSRIAAIDKTTGLATSWNPGANQYVTDFAQTADTIYAVGLFTTIAGVSRSRVAELDKTTGAATAWAPTPNGAVGAIALEPTHIVMGGFWFRLNNAGDGREDLARFSFTTTQFASNASSVTEADTTKNIEVTLSQAEPADTTVDFAVTGGSATGGVDYTLANATATFIAGQTTTNIAVAIHDDDLTEGDETIEVTLSNPSNAISLGSPIVHTLTITDSELMTDPVTRVSGTDPIETSILISKDTFNTGQAEAIVLARNDNWVDAFTITPLASQTHASLLLNPTSSLDSRVLAEIQRVLSSTSGRIFLAGGTEALSEQVALDLSNAGYTVQTRFPGKHRRETARLIANEIVSRNSGVTSEVFVADDRAFVDAVTIGPQAGNIADGAANPILLQPRYGTSVDPSLSKFFVEHPSVTKATLVGGTTSLPAVFATALASQTSTLTTIDRLAGKNRFETNYVVNSKYFPNPVAAVLSNGQKEALVGATQVGASTVGSYSAFITALLAGRLAASIPAPLVLVEQDLIPAPSLQYLQEHASSIGSAVIVGDTNTVSANVEAQTAVAIQ
jgi:putative cell wall-binding protein